MSSLLKKQLITPRAPAHAASFVDGAFAVVSLVRARGDFSLGTSAVTPIPDDILAPSFEAPNILIEHELKAIILQTVEAAGLSNKKHWSVALPEGVARSTIVNLETKPGTSRELGEMIVWKVERVVGAPSSDLRVTRQRISPAGGDERYLVTVAFERVLDEYESLFNTLGWHTGILLPRHLGEAQWLLWDSSPGDKILISSNRSGFTTIISREGEPVLVRALACDAAARFDELYRLVVYYRDRIAGETAGIGKALVLGDFDRDTARQAVGDAVGVEPSILDPVEFGFDLRGEPLRFDQLAAAAGLASLAWQ
jgi:hypothetical protein